jgi:cell division inhibitor SulA
MSAKTLNPVLRQLRETAALLRKPQAEVAANWLRARGVLQYSESMNIGITAEQHSHATRIISRLARSAEYSTNSSRE